MGQRTVLVTAHTGRENALRSARFVTERLLAVGIAVRTLAGEFSAPGAEQVPVSDEAAQGAELVIVLGGDGALLRAAEFSRPARTRPKAPSSSSSWAATAPCCAPPSSPARPARR